MNHIRKNLKLLRDGILGIPDEFIDMETFRSEDGKNIEFLGEDDCGSVGCIMGWAPFIKGLETVKDDYGIDYKGEQKMHFSRYGQRVFFSTDRAAWHWVFSQEWTPIDNTALGAVLRIQYLLDNGLNVPDGFLDPKELGEYIYSKELYIQYIEEHLA